MIGDATFAEVLEQKLVAFSPLEPVVVPAPPTPSYQAPHPLLFTKRRMTFNSAVYGAARPAAAASSLTVFIEPPHAAPRTPPQAAPPTPPQAAPSARPRRAMTLAERRALEDLVALGADLAGDFSAQDLRRTYRRLARRYHPDCHPSSNRGEQARLARVFAQLNESYRQLKMLFADADTQH
jgi:hypothetical protein